MTTTPTLALIALSLLSAATLTHAQDTQAPQDPRPVRKTLQVLALAAPGGIDLPIAPYAGVTAVQGHRQVTPVAVATPTQYAPTAAPTDIVRRYDIRLTDGTLSRALSRWVTPTDLPIQWEAPKDLPVVAAAYQGTFLEALEQVMADTQRSQYPLHACAFDNVVRILHTSQTCQR